MERNLFEVTHGLLLSHCDGEHASRFETVALQHQKDYTDFIGAKTFLAGFWSNQLAELGRAEDGQMTYMHVMTCRTVKDYEQHLINSLLPIINDYHLAISSP